MTAPAPETAPALLVDTYSLLFRAWFVLPPMSTAAGTPTNALYGFSVLLVKLLREERPSGLAFALDVGASFRQTEYAEYKATRPTGPSPVALRLAQLPGLLAARPLVDPVGGDAVETLREAFTALEFKSLLPLLEALRTSDSSSG